jgi:hypothetical protein
VETQQGFIVLSDAFLGIVFPSLCLCVKVILGPEFSKVEHPLTPQSLPSQADGPNEQWDRRTVQTFWTLQILVPSPPTVSSWTASRLEAGRPNQVHVIWKGRGGRDAPQSYINPHGPPTPEAFLLQTTILWTPTNYSLDDFRISNHSFIHYDL